MPYIKLPRTGMEIAVGNLKVGKDTAIMNITSATDCESLKKGLCQVPKGECYALKAERQYPKCLPYRRRQTKIWDNSDVVDLAQDIKDMLKQRRKMPIKYLRMQEAGDFRNQADVDKMSQLADALRGVVKVYTYTARKDLDFTGHSSNLVINGSGFKREGVNSSFKVVDTKGYAACPKGYPSSFDCNKCEAQCNSPRCRGIKGGGCLECELCKAGGGKIIRELLRVGKGTGSMDKTGNTDEHGGVDSLELAPGIIGDLTPGIKSKSKKRKTTKKNKADMDTGIVQTLL
jgi:hypothetical protein